MAFHILLPAGVETGLVNDKKSKEKRKPSEGDIVVLMGIQRD